MSDALLDPEIVWDDGTAYDFFVSLSALHNPDAFGLRPAWAAGMRSRLPSAEREVLERIHPSEIPLGWVHQLPDPKDGRVVLRAFHSLSPLERLRLITGVEHMEEEGGISILEEVADAGEWKAEHKKGLQELEAIGKHYREEGDLESLLDSWADPETTGERLMSALSAYYEGFFIEEERRIRPALMQALTEAKRSREKGLPVVDLLEQLSQGVRLDEPFTKSELVLAPSYWATPLLIFGEVSPERQIILFGARSPEESLVPGETVPESLLRILKALSDPTRLRILRYLSEEPLTPTQLSQRLRLRSSTVVHHLNTLRLATLVQLKVGPGKEKYYSAREESVEAAHRALQEFLSQEEVELPVSEEATP